MPDNSLDKMKELRNDVIRGSLCAVMEVLINQPLFTIKTRMQQNQKITFSPTKLYCGTFTNILSMAPITACQVALTTIVNDHVKEQFNNENLEKSFSAFCGGGFSALISCSSENIMGHQNICNTNLRQTVNKMMSNKGLKSLWKGLPATSARDALFTVCFLAIPPYLKQQIENHYKEPINTLTLNLAAGLLSGILAAILTQPFDTIRASQSANNSGFFSTTKKIINAEGLSALWRGGLPRGLRVISAINIMTFVSEKILEYCNDESCTNISSKNNF